MLENYLLYSLATVHIIISLKSWNKRTSLIYIGIQQSLVTYIKIKFVPHLYTVRKNIFKNLIIKIILKIKKIKKFLLAC